MDHKAGLTLPPTTHLVVDCHVHLYDASQLQTLLESAWHNLLAAATAVTPAPGASVLPVLVFTSTAWEPGFASIRAAVGPPNAHPPDDGWWIKATDEDASVLFCKGNRRMVGIAGAQVVTEESLEVLLIGTTTLVPDGTPVRRVLDEGFAAGAVCVLPWSPGKWWFRRGRLVRRMIDEYASPPLFLGDSAQRPRVWRWPFQPGHRAGSLGVLSGSDPLPFRRQARLAGLLGSLMEGRLSAAAPAESLLRLLVQQPRLCTTVGRRTSPAAFLCYQVGMQLRRRRRATATMAGTGKPAASSSGRAR